MSVWPSSELVMGLRLDPYARGQGGVAVNPIAQNLRLFARSRNTCGIQVDQPSGSLPH